ncbi:sulfate transporter family-domain-containing protein [Thelephora terrestris]|uniref:Sulfate transporter family-domain-containing protein n=1 Tax=Thelephora terrestris TaxID=56493 RepID=A0A9P6HJ87_9AGAM|nr:sulfate transporter family-domain-containing protein [Thelephora terrestris]
MFRIQLSSASKTARDRSGELLVTCVRSLPAVLLGVLLNILDGVSYGLIIFPTSGMFADLGGLGVSMFFVSTVIAQLVYSSGKSGFAGANGSMMIEVVPFFHIIATSLASEIGEGRPHEVIATTLAAFAFSSILTGLTFFLLGALRLGALIGFFPRHILIGCIGGVGVFLIVTGCAVCTGLKDEDFSLSYRMLQWLFLNLHNLVLWLPAFCLAILLRVITHKYHHQLIFPAYFLLIPIVFYVIVAIGRLNLGELRAAGWLFTTGGSNDPWYKFYTLFDFRAIQWGPFWNAFPTQLALLFFNILHPPLNVPALSVSLNEDVDTNKELVAHGYSNLLAGMFGTVPNYLVYVNTLLFYRVGGTTRVAGFMLAGATALLLVIGTGPISYIPVMLVGALIFVLGIDLVKEALWDTRNRVNKLEYLTIVSIMIAMTVWDFVAGVLFGIVASCFFFVVQNSQHNSIRALHTGETAMSTVRRPSAHRAYLREVSKQTTIVRLQGFLFFGTITNVEESIRGLVEGDSWAQNPIRFLVVDLSLVYGVDMSAAEGFVRLQRLLSSKMVVLVFCGFRVDSSVGKSLSSVGLFDEEYVECFETCNDVMEWSENVYLRAWFSVQKEGSTSALALPGRQGGISLDPITLAGSPRLSHLHDAGQRTFCKASTDLSSPPGSPEQPGREPAHTIAKAFSYNPEFDAEQFKPLVNYLERQTLPEGHVLFKQGDVSDALYIIESGVLRALYRFAEHSPTIEESMVPGTLAGELTGLSGLERNATVLVERDAVVWKLSREKLKVLEREQPDLARVFTRLISLILSAAAKVDYDILLSALATR